MLPSRRRAFPTAVYIYTRAHVPRRHVRGIARDFSPLLVRSSWAVLKAIRSSARSRGSVCEPAAAAVCVWDMGLLAVFSFMGSSFFRRAPGRLSRRGVRKKTLCETCVFRSFAFRICTRRIKQFRAGKFEKQTQHTHVCIEV